MKSNRKVWVAIYLVGFAIFAAGWFGHINESAYFPIFVGFAMLFALAVNIYWWRTHKIVRRD